MMLKQHWWDVQTPRSTVVGEQLAVLAVSPDHMLSNERQALVQ